MPIDLWAELTDVGKSARQIAEDRRATTAFEKSRLRDDPEVRATIDEDKQSRKEALTLLATRVHAFADYRDRVHRLTMTLRRDKNALSRAVQRVSDQQATDRLR
jgi:hemoglobin-like flavoprotein